MRYQIRLVWEHGLGVLELLFDGPLGGKSEQVTKLVVGLCNYPPTNEGPHHVAASRLAFRLIPFYYTEEGFADLRAKLAEGLNGMGFVPLRSS